MDIDGVLIAVPIQLTCFMSQRETRKIQAITGASTPTGGESPELTGLQQSQRMGSSAGWLSGTAAGAALHRPLPPPSGCLNISVALLNHKQLSLQLFYATYAIPVEKWKTVYFLYCLGQAGVRTIFSKLSNSKSGFLFNTIKKILNYKKSPLVCKCPVSPAAEDKCRCHTPLNVIQHNSGRKILHIKCSAF